MTLYRWFEQDRDEVMSSKPLTILQILPALKAGGVERGTVDIAASQVKAGMKALVVSNGGPMVEELENVGARHIQMPVHSKKPWVMWDNVHKLVALCQQEKVDLIHARSRAPAWSALGAARQLKIPFLTTFHGTYNAGNPLKKWYNSVMARGDRVIAISHFIADHIAQEYPQAKDRIVTIPRGSDLEKFDPAKVTTARQQNIRQTWQLADDEARPLILLPGRFARWKGHIWLIEALALIRNNHPDTEFLCLLMGDAQGNPPYLQEIHERIAALGLSQYVRLVDHCRDMPAALSLADIVVSTSTDPEAFGRVAVEAQLMEVPVVASHHGGSVETVIDGQTGYLVPVNDRAALSERLTLLLTMTDDQHQQIGRQGRQHAVTNYGLDQMAEKTLAIYRELTSGY